MEPPAQPTPTPPSPAPNPGPPQPPVPPTPPTPPSPSPAPTPAATPPPPVPPSPVPGAVAATPPVPDSAPTSQGQVVVGGFDPAATTVAGGAEKPPISFGLPGEGGSSGRKPIPRRLLLGLTAVVVGIVGFSAFYFGYYTSPKTVYSQSLKNTGKGYDKLIEYGEEQSGKNYKGLTANGTYEIKGSGMEADGQFSAKTYELDGEYKLDIGYSGVRVNGEVRSITSTGTTPDIYVKVDGLEGLGSMLGSAEIDQTLSKVNNQWIFIDHTIFDQLTAQAGQQETKTPSEADVIDALKSFGEVNQEYVYTTASDKAVLKIVKNKGKETFGERTTYRYEVGFNKDNLKKYIDAQKAALEKNKLGKWFKDNNYQKEVDAAFDSMKKDVDDIKESDTIDMWMDSKQRIVYKVRVTDSEKTQSYVDLGLDYTGGDKYPFFIAGNEDGTKIKLVAELDAKTNKWSVNMDVDGSGTEVKVQSDFTPTNAKVSVEKPAGAKPIAQVWQELGLGDLNAQLQQAAQSATPSAAPDDAIQANGLNGINQLASPSGLSAAAGVPGAVLEQLLN